MQADERQRRILARARANGRVDVGDVAAELDVAPETVRRDLKLLDQHGLVRRTHGGAVPVETAGYETGIAYRATSHLPEKRRIALMACANNTTHKNAARWLAAAGFEVVATTNAGEAH